jgi:hypothetical protein
MSPSRDFNLEQYATPGQWRAYCAFTEHGSFHKAAAELGLDRRGVARSVRTLLAKAAAKGYAPEKDLNHPLPDGQVLRGVSTLYDGDGNLRQQWVKTQQEDIDKVAAWRATIDELVSQVKPADPIPEPPEGSIAEEILAGYPIGDHHLGMLAWRIETGEDWDLKIGEKMLWDTLGHLVRVAPAAETALIAFLGDFMHYDGHEAVTPTAGNALDADGRFPKMVRAAIRAMRNTIDQVARKHRNVRVIIEIGNHDLSSSIFLQEAMSVLYENSPRVTIDTSPAHYHYFEFGVNLIGVHHGHGAKAAQLPGIMATDQHEAWGRTQHRVWWTGHVHHMRAQEYPGATVESFRVLAPKDAWHHQKGYRSLRNMQGIAFHRDVGEIARATVNPGMFR